jgi:hypothetical protein
MPLSNDALIFGLGHLRGSRSKLSFGGEGAEMRITPRARAALDELIAEGYAVRSAPDCQTRDREYFQGVVKTPHLGELALAAGIDPFSVERWTTFERISQDPAPSP